jgi:hypothetical protein
MYHALVTEAILMASLLVYWRLPTLYFLFGQNARMNSKFTLAPKEAERSWNMGSQRQAAKLPPIELAQSNIVAGKENVHKSVMLAWELVSFVSVKVTGSR